jgi:hypothetical protein
MLGVSHVIGPPIPHAVTLSGVWAHQTAYMA